MLILCLCVIFAEKEDPGDDLPIIAPPKQKKRSKPTDAVKQSELASGQ